MGKVSEKVAEKSALWQRAVEAQREFNRYLQEMEEDRQRRMQAKEMEALISYRAWVEDKIRETLGITITSWRGLDALVAELPGLRFHRWGNRASDYQLEVGLDVAMMPDGEGYDDWEENSENFPLRQTWNVSSEHGWAAVGEACLAAEALGGAPFVPQPWIRLDGGGTVEEPEESQAVTTPLRYHVGGLSWLNGLTRPHRIVNSFLRDIPDTYGGVELTVFVEFLDVDDAIPF